MKLWMLYPPKLSRLRRKIKVVGRFFSSLAYFILPARIGGAPDGYDVSATSYGWRLLTAGIALSSFSLGSDSVRAVYFTVDDEEKPTPWKRLLLWWLRQKGVEVLRGPRRGPHSKYWYYLNFVWEGDRPFMLIDDDVIYEHGIADLLYNEARTVSGNVCVRSLVFGADDAGVQPYRTWSPCLNQCTGHMVFATNVGGVVIKPAFARLLKTLGEEYRTHCSTADDVWFHWVAVRHDMPYCQITSEFKNPVPIPFTQAKGLSNTVNVSGNDLAVSSQYGSVDIERIRLGRRRYFGERLTANALRNV